MSRAISVTPELPVPNLAEAVAFWSELLGIEPSFVDGERWAQFDVGGTRLALAGTDRVSEAAGVMIKVEDLAPFIGREAADGSRAEAQRGSHETRLTLSGPGDHPTVLYDSA